MPSSQQIRLRVTDMTCGHCERRVKEALLAVPGVTSAQVDHTSDSAVVKGDVTVSSSALTAAVEAAGYGASTEDESDPDDDDGPIGQASEPPPEADDPNPKSPAPAPSPSSSPGEGMERARLSITGMSCASCVARIETTLAGQPGVQRASVQLLGEGADVTFDPTQISAQALVAAVEGVGYGASLRGRRSQSEAPTDDVGIPHLKARIALTLSVGVVAMVLSMPLMHGDAHGPFAWLMAPIDALFMAVIPVIYDIPHSTLRFVLLFLSLPVMTWAGGHFFTRAYKLIQHRSADMNTLIALGTGAAFVYSAFVTLLPSAATSIGLPLDVWFEAIPFVMGFVMLGRLLEARAKSEAGAAIRALSEMRPREARRVKHTGAREMVPLEEVQLGDTLEILAGEAMPVDGVVLEGESKVNESLLTGEAASVAKSPGESVFEGTLNGHGVLMIQAKALGEETALGHIIAMVEAAQAIKPEAQRLADKVAGVFVPVVVAIAILSALVWGVVGPDPSGGYAIRALMTVLIIACPCAMGLAVPTAVAVATGWGAKHGILVASGAALEGGHRVTTVVFDKTGTLTLGRPRVVNAEFVAGSGFLKPQILGFLRGVEASSEHPIGAALVAYAEEQGAVQLQAQNVVTEAGGGIRGEVDGQEILLGNGAYLRKRSVDTSALEEASAHWEEGGETPVFMAISGVLVAHFGLRDALKPTARAAVDGLKAMGLKVAMLSGDREGTAQAIASSVGIETVYAEALPGHKAEVINALREAGENVAMVGDGINDAPALAAADLSIAMGEGTDVARAAADITLVQGDLRGVVNVMRLSRRTVTIIYQNLGWAFVYNLIGIPIAAGLLYPFFGILLSPIFASAAMAFSSVSVVLSALRLRRLEGVA